VDDVKQAIEIAGRSLLEEKAKHAPLLISAGTGVTLGTIFGYAVAGMAFLSTIYVMYKTSREIKLINMRIENEKKEDP